MTRELPKIEYGSPEWNRSLAKLANDYLNVTPCRDCGAAKCREYICMRCGSDR